MITSKPSGLPSFRLSVVAKCDVHPLLSGSLNNHDVSAVVKRVSPGVRMLDKVLLIPKKIFCFVSGR